MKIKKGDTVMIRTGRERGKTGKVVSVDPKLQTVTVDGINVSKKHTKPSQKNSQGGVFEITKPVNVSKVGLVHPTNKKRTSRVGFTFNKKGDKVRVFRQAGNKEIK